MRIISIDRYEGTLAICEDKDGKFFGIESSELPEGACEGTVLKIDDEAGTLTIDETETNRRRKKNAKLQDSVFGK
jgi:hypothetical protein